MFELDSTKNALNLAKYIVTKCMKEDCPINNLQLQFILYSIQANVLKKSEGCDLAFFDNFEAHTFGPMIPEVYYHFCGYGGLTILDRYDLPKEINSKFSLDCKMNSIIEEKRAMKPWELMKEVRKKKGAWNAVFADGKGAKKIIPISMIRELG